MRDICLSRLGIFVLLCVTVHIAVSCNSHRSSENAIFTAEELAIINDTVKPLMKVYTVTDKMDSVLLRTKCGEFTPQQLQSKEYKILCQRMVKTVTDSTVDGVGIAGPQVGISKRIVAVQRYDKEGFPFETYSNIYIKEYSQECEIGREGCLSVPDKSGMVERSQWVIISYTEPQSLQIVQDTVRGFTARIFQHEVDHLEGVVYTDKLLPELGY